MQEPAAPTWSLADWTVLGLLVEQPRHGFALVKELGPDTLLGQVYSIPNPMIYRALRVLQERGMAAPAAEQASKLGPRRVPVLPTSEGRRRFERWRLTPIDHFRDARMLLRIKLHLTVRLGQDPVPLLLAQREAFTRLGQMLETGPTEPAQHGSAGESGQHQERALMQLWRAETSAATMNFLDGALLLFRPGTLPS